MRVHIFVRLFSNPEIQAYLRELSAEFAVSTNAVRTELNRLKAYKLVLTEQRGRKVYYRSNTDHPLFPELVSMVRKSTGLTVLTDLSQELLKCDKIEYVTGDCAKGSETQPI